MLVAAVTLLVFAVVPFVVARGYARRVEQADSPLEDRLHRLRRGLLFGLLAIAPTAVLLGHFTGTLEMLMSGATSVIPGAAQISAIETLTAIAVGMGVVSLPAISAFLGVFPVQRSLRETDASTQTAARRFALGIALGAIPGLIWIGIVVLLPSSVQSSTAAMIALFAVFIPIMFAVQPYLIAIFSDRVPLEGTQRDRIEELCADIGFEPQGIYLLEGESMQAANAVVAGTIPQFRYVFLTDYLLTECDDEQLKAILAHEYGHVAGKHLWQRGIMTVGVFALWMVGYEFLPLAVLEEQYGFIGFFVPVMLLFALYFVVFLGGLSRWQEFRADAYAADIAGNNVTATALETIASANDARRESGLLYSLVTQHPPIGTRIKRLREQE